MNTKYRLLFFSSVSLIIFLLITSCTTMPSASEEETAAQGIATNSIMEVMNLIELGTIKPQPIKITTETLELPFYQYFNMKHTKNLGSAFRFSDIKVGTENSGFLRKEDPLIVFPIMDDPVETDTFTTVFDVWQFEGVKDQKIDLMVRSLSTFPTGMFVPYLLLLDAEGKILGRQEHILNIDKEKIKGLSIMIWIENYILPETGKYYLMVLADNSKREEKVSREPMIRIGNERILLYTVFENEGWIMYGQGDYFDPEWDQKPMPNLYYDPKMLFGYGGGIAQGKYLVMLWGK